MRYVIVYVQFLKKLKDEPNVIFNSSFPLNIYVKNQVATANLSICEKAKKMRMTLLVFS